jgi:triosephosphate isomerase
MKPLIIANWKMNPQSLAEAKRLFNSVKKGIKNIKEIEIVICPPFIYIPTFQHSSIPTIKLGAQNCFWENSGPFTGEISPLMLKNLGCQYVILGHSERERYFGETDEMTNKKVKAALSAKLKPILCIGETKKVKKKKEIFKILKKQLRAGLKGIGNWKLEIENLIIAYEPVWAVGTGKPCPVKEARIGLLAIRKIISHLYDSSLAKKIKIIYGGSVNSKIAKDYIQKANFQGLLIGGASLNPSEFLKIIKKINRG